MARNIDKIIEESKKRREELKKKKEENTSTSITSPSRIDKIVDKSRLEKTIGFDTFDSDLKSLGTTIEGIYKGWQTEETMKNTRSSIEAMQNRIGAYQEYRKRFGITEGEEDITKLADNYKTILGDWDTISSYYGGYKTAEDFNAAKTNRDNLLKADTEALTNELKPYKDIYDFAQKEEKTKIPASVPIPHKTQFRKTLGDRVTKELKDKGIADNMSYDELIAYVEEKQTYIDQAKSFQNYTYDMEKGFTLEELEARVKAEGEDALAYTTPDGGNITWKNLRDHRKADADFQTLYDKYSKRDDWEEISKYNKSDFDPRDRYFLAAATGIPRTQGDDEEKSAALNMTPEERALYLAMYKTEGKEIANEWNKSRHFLYEERGQERMDKMWSSFSKNVPVVSDLVSVPLNLLGGLEWVGNAISGKSDETSQLSRASSTIRNTRMEQVNLEIAGWDAFDFVYGATMSGIDSLTASAIFSPLGAAGTTAAKFAHNTASGLSLGLSAAAQGTNDALERGLTGSDAFRHGFMSGVFEGAFETISIGKFNALKESLNDGTFKTFAKNLGKSMLTNASEETLTEIANIAYDTIANTDFSQYETMVRQYTMQGMSVEDAQAKAKSELKNQVWEAMASGAFMGAGFGTIGHVQSVRKTKSLYGDKDSTQALIDEGLESPVESESHSLAEELKGKVDSGKSLSGGELLHLVTANQGTIKSETMAKAESMLKELGESNTSDIADIIAKKTAGEELTKAEIKALKNSEYGMRVYNEINNEDLVGYTNDMSDQEKNLFLSMYDMKENGLDAERYANSFQLVSEYAKNNFSQDYMLQNKGALTASQVGAIYKSKILDSDKALTNALDSLKAKHKGTSFIEGTFNDSVINYDNTKVNGKVNWNSLNPSQKKSIVVLGGLGKRAGLDVELISDGLERGINGAFSISDNKMLIDIYAGMNKHDVIKMNNLIIPTISHEMTHWMKTKSPELYRKLDNYVFETLMMGGKSEQEILAARRNKMEAAHPGVVYSDADVRDEVIARANEDIFAQSKEIKNMLNSLTDAEKKTFVDKVKEILQSIKDWIDDFLSKTTKSTADEAKMIAEYKERIDGQIKLWDAMLVESIEANQALKKEGITAEELAKSVIDKDVALHEMQFNERLVEKHIDMLNKNYSEESALPLDTLLARYEKIVDIWKSLGGELNSKFLEDWNNKVGTDRTFSVFKAQAGYKYNVELSSMCKKGIPLFEAIDKIVKDEAMRELKSKTLGKAEKEILYDILKENHFEIPCAICYVEQARQREGVIIDAFLNGKIEKNASGKVTQFKLGWNETLSNVQKEMKSAGFDFTFPMVNRSIATDNYSPADLTMDEETQGHFFEALKKVANNEIRRYNKESGKNRKLITKTDAKSINEAFKGKLPLNLAMFKVMFTEPSSRFMIADDLLYSSMTTQNPAAMHNGLYGIFNSQGGVGGYKTKQGTIVYWADILGKKWTPSKLRNEGGVRNQSNSDFLMYTLLDHAQMYIDFTAKGYYLQAYTKVLSELKLFGLSKGKINASFIPKVLEYRDANGNVDVAMTQLNAGLDEQGNPIYDDIEGVNHNEAFMLIEDAEYSKSIGGVCIGYSDNHILKLLDDNRIQLIIGFHDKTNDTSKRYKGAVYAKNYNGLNEATKLDKDGKLKTVHIGFNQFIRKAENKFKDKDTIEYNGKTYKYNDIPKLATDLYLEHCESKGLFPAYSQGGTDFSKHPNYYKLLADFSLYDINGNYAPHQKVEYNMPDRVPFLDKNGKKAYMPTKDYIKNELQKELSVRDDISAKLADKSENGIIPQFIERANALYDKQDMQLADRDLAKLDAEYLELAKNPEANEARLREMVDEAAKRMFPNSALIQDGEFRKMWHHTNKSFNSFLPGTSESSGKLKGIYFTPQEYSSMSHLGNIHKQYYLNVENLKFAFGVETDKAYVKKLRALQEGIIDRNEIAKINRAFKEETSVDAFFDWQNGWYNILTPEQIKSADLVTYDDNGNIIPLSQRFDNYNGDIRYADREDVEFWDKQLYTQLSDWFNGFGKKNGSFNGKYFEIGETPSIFVKHGAPNSDLIMYPDCVEKITGQKSDEGHMFAIEEIAKLPSQLNDPILLFKGSVPNSFVALTEILDKHGNDAIVAVHIHKKYGRSVINKIASVYSKTDAYGNNKIVSYVMNQVANGNLVEASNKKAPKWFTSKGLQLPKLVQTILDANNSIRNPEEKVNKNADRDSEGNTLTKEQIAFFKESKARDENGNLWMLYHGTDKAGFTKFDTSLGKFGGNWFTTSRKDADSYAGNYKHKLFDPNEKDDIRSSVGGNFNLNAEMRFDSEEDLEKFKKENPIHKSYLTDEEITEQLSRAKKNDDWDEYDRLESYQYSNERINLQRAYLRYEWEHSRTATIGEIIDNPSQFSVNDILRAYDVWDKNNGARESLQDGATKEDLIEGFVNYENELEDASESIRDLPFKARLNPGESGTIENYANNRTYACYVNAINPYEIDAHNNTLYKENLYGTIEKAMKNSSYDSVIIRNVRVGGYEELGNVVIIKDSNQAKLSSNQNPTSNSDMQFADRDDVSVYDLMGETDRLIKENELLKDDIGRLKSVIGGEKIPVRRFRSLADYLKKQTGSNISREELGGMLEDAYTFIQNTDVVEWVDVVSKTYDIANHLINQNLPVSINYFKEVMSKIRKDTVSLTTKQKTKAGDMFDGYNNFHRFMFGRINITDKGTPLSEMWEEWSKAYPEIFKADVSETEQIETLVNIVDTLKATSTLMGEFEREEAIRHLSTEIYNQFWNIASDSSDISKEAKTQHRKLMETLRKEYEARQGEKALHPVGETALKYETLFNKMSRSHKAEVDRIKEIGKERMDAYKEHAERKTKIQSITANALTLNKWLVKNSKDEHIHEAMKGPVINLLQAIDFSSKQMLEKNIPTQKDVSFAKAFAGINEMLIKANNAEEELVELYGHDLADGIKSLMDAADRLVGDNNYVINKMTLEELNHLDRLVKYIKKVVTDLNKFHVVNHAKGIANLSQEEILYADSIGKAKVYDPQTKKAKVHKLLSWDNAVPYYAFKRFGAAGQKIFEAFQDGWDKLAFHASEVIEFTKKAYTSEEIKAWEEDIRTFNILVPANEVELADPNYKPQYQSVQMSIPQIMSLYCLQKRQQAIGHMLGGGIRVANIKKKNGELISQEDGFILSKKDIRTIIGTLSNRQMQVANTLQNFMNTTCSDWGNEVSMLRFGYKAFGEENYFPIQSDKNNLAVEDETEKTNSLFQLLNMSFTKSVQENANNRIVISDIFDVFAQHASDMAKYNALALPVLDAFRWYNYTEKVHKGETQHITKSVKTSIEKAFGEEGKKYITTFLKDINGQKNVGRDTLGKGFFSNAKVASVAMNLRVMMLQPTAFLKASAIVDNKYLTRALAHKPKISRAEKYCGMALWKSLGYYDTDISKGLTEKIKHAETWKDKTVEKSLKGAEWADKITFGYLWNACELEIRDTRKDLKVGSQEFNEAIGKRLREVIYATQVVDSTMTRSQIMRSGNMYEKLLTAFSSEPTLAYNMLQDAYMEMRLDGRKNGKKIAFKNHGKKAMRVLWAYTITNAVAALIESGFDALRDDDEEEMDAEKFMALYLSNFGFDMSLTAKVPYIKEAISIAQGFTSSRSDTQWMQSLSYAIKGALKIAQGEGDAYSTYKHILRTVSYLSGLPFYNAHRDLMATLNKLEILTTEDIEEMFGDSED